MELGSRQVHCWKASFVRIPETTFCLTILRCNNQLSVFIMPSLNHKSCKWRNVFQCSAALSSINSRSCKLVKIRHHETISSRAFRLQSWKYSWFFCDVILYDSLPWWMFAIPCGIPQFHRSLESVYRLTLDTESYLFFIIYILQIPRWLNYDFVNFLKTKYLPSALSYRRFEQLIVYFALAVTFLDVNIVPKKWIISLMVICIEFLLFSLHILQPGMEFCAFFKYLQAAKMRQSRASQFSRKIWWLQLDQNRKKTCIYRNVSYSPRTCRFYL